MARPSAAFFQYAHDSAGSTKMAVDGSSPAVDFDIFAPTGPLYLYRVNASIIDGSMTPGRFGGLSELSNGLLVRAVDSDGAVVVDFLDGASIVKNADWAALSGVDNTVITAAGDDSMPVGWNLSKGLGEPLYLAAGCRLRFTVRDDLSDLTEFMVFGQGRTE